MTILKNLTAVSVLIAAGSLCAQESVGTIQGIVRAPDGSPIAGATITLSGDALLGPRIAVTGADGRYQLRMLIAGRYTLRVSAPNYVGRSAEVSVASGSTMSQNFDLRLPEAAGATVDIVGGELAILDKTETKVASTFTATDLVNAPTGGQVAYSGALFMSPGVSGSRVRGGVAGTAQYTLNGVSTRLPSSGAGQQYAYFFEDMIQDIQIVQNATNARYGQSNSGMIAATTITGSNRFSGTFRAVITNQSWQTFNMGPHPNRWNELESGQTQREPYYEAFWSGTALTLFQAQQDEVDRHYRVTFSGPIIKDKLTFSYSGRLVPNIESSNTRRNVLGSNVANYSTYIPGFIYGDPRYTGPNPTGSGEAEQWAGYLWDANPNSPTTPLYIRATLHDVTNFYKFFYQITPNHQVEYNYSGNQYLNGVSINNFLGEIPNIQSYNNRLQKSGTYRGLIANGLLTALWGQSYITSEPATGPLDPLYVQTWTSTSRFILDGGNRGTQSYSGGNNAARSANESVNMSLDYNRMFGDHNVDVGFQQLKEKYGAKSRNVDGLAFYSPARRHDGMYMVFNVGNPDSPIWTGEGFEPNMAATLESRRATLFNSGYLPVLVDYNSYGTGNAVDPFFENTNSSIYVNDNWKINENMAVNLGLRYDTNKGEDVTGERYNSSTISPRFRLQYDLFGNSKHVFAFIATQARGTLTRAQLGRYGFAQDLHTRRYGWNQGTTQPYWVTEAEVRNPANYGYYWSFNDDTALFTIDHGLKPEQTTTFELNYRRPFDEGGFFRASIVHNFTKDLRLSTLIDEEVLMTDPLDPNKQPNSPTYGWKRYLTNSDRKRHYTGLEMEWMLPLLRASSYSMNWNGNWTVAKAMSSASLDGLGANVTGTFLDRLDELGVPRDVWDPWIESSIPRHKMRTWFTVNHGIRGGVMSTFVLMGAWESGTPTGLQTQTYTLPYYLFNNSDSNGGRVSGMPSNFTAYPVGKPGDRHGYSHYRVDLQWNFTIPLKNRLSIFCEMMIGQIFNSFKPESHNTYWTAGNTPRTWTPGEVNGGDPLWGTYVATTASGRNWGTVGTNALSGTAWGQRRYFAWWTGYGTNAQFDIGFKF